MELKYTVTISVGKNPDPNLPKELQEREVSEEEMHTFADETIRQRFDGGHDRPWATNSYTGLALWTEDIEEA